LSLRDLRRWGTVALLALVASAAASAQDPPAPPTLRLPEGARPLRYALTLTVVPGEAKAAGEMSIDIELDRDHPVLWLNGELLDVRRAVVDGAIEARILPRTDPFVGLAFDPPLRAGRHRLVLGYEADQSRNSTRGVFTLQEAGAWYTMTHFEPLAARRAFPCFDEPSYKVPWQLTLRVPHDVAAFSNTHGVEGPDDDPALKRVRFAETRPLPSYLVAFAVGPFETVAAGRTGMRPTPSRIIVPGGRRADAAFAASAFPQLFEHTERWFAIAHPYEKLDHIAIPLTVGFAMENAGLVTYGAPTLLAKPGATSPRFRRGAANIGAHEIAHQWFGNLVTPMWWDDLWLNEAFANWFAEKIVDRWRPDYERGTNRVHERAQAIHEDALVSARRIREPIVVEADIRAAFDSITYQKGATVIAMFERWIGPQTFRRGVRNYLRANADGNATTTQFLETLTATSRKPVAPAFSTFLEQNGVPQIAVTLDCAQPGRPVVTLRQQPHAPIGVTRAAQRWQVPVCVRYGAGAQARRACTLLAEEGATLPLRGACPRYVMANDGGAGYYVADYQGDLLERLAKTRATLSTAEYTSLLYDLRALVRSGAVDAAVAFDWIATAAKAGDFHVTTAAIDAASFLRDTVVDEASEERYDAFVRAVFADRARALGFASRIAEGDEAQMLRRTLLRFAAPSDPGLSARARELAHAWITDRKAVEPALIDTVLLVAAAHGDTQLFDALLAEARRTRDGLERRDIVTALMSFRDASLAERGLSLLLDPAFDIRETTNAMWRMHWFTPPRRAAHAFVMANFDALSARVQKETPGGWPDLAEQLCTQRDDEAVAAFWQPRIASYASGRRALAKTREAIQLCAKLRDAQSASAASYLSRF
jgi:alanyl aminopeptidase